jgi:hypothetical protein
MWVEKGEFIMVIGSNIPPISWRTGEATIVLPSESKGLKPREAVA